MPLFCCPASTAAALLPLLEAARSRVAQRSGQHSQSYVNLPDTTLPQHPERVAWPQLSSDAGNADAEPTERLQLLLCGAV